MGKILIILLAIVALGGGALLYYQQVYAYYYDVTPNGTTDVRITARATGRPQPVQYSDFRAIDADSSPIRYRACFTTTATRAALDDTYVVDTDAVPLIAPGWFDCFDAEEVGEALEAGRATAYLGVKDIHYGIDRIVAIDEDGRGWAWNQINRCGKIVFNGEPAPDDCPPAPEGY